MLATSLGLIGAIGVGATLAYFTDTQTVENTITMGNVNITLTEESVDGVSDGAGGYIYGKLPEGYDGVLPEIDRPILPGDDLDKRAWVTMEAGTADAHLRMQVTLKLDGDLVTEDNDPDTYSIVSMEAQMEKAVTDANTANNVAGEAWTFDDSADAGWSWTYDANTGQSVGVGYFYCQLPQAAGADIPFMNNFVIPTSWDNAAADKGFSITLIAEAIQDDYFDVDANGIWSNKAPDVQTYTP